MRRYLSGVLLPLLVVLVFTQPVFAAKVMIDDFEQGVGDWVARSSSNAQGECVIESVQGGAPAGGTQSARISFTASKTGWAYVSRTVDGYQLAKAGCNVIEFSLRGDGSGQPLRITLIVEDPQSGEVDAYSQPLKFEGLNWDNGISLRFPGFRKANNEPLSADRVQYITALQLGRSGSWSAFRFRIDQIAGNLDPQAPRVPAPVGQPVTPQPVLQVNEAFRLTPDFAKTGTVNKAQIGLNLGQPPTLVDSRDKQTVALAYGTVSDLSPTTVRLRLNDYYNMSKNTYDLTLLVKHARWIVRSSSRPLICLAQPRGKENESRTLKQKRNTVFVQTVTDLVKQLNKEKANVVYEIFNDPLTGDIFPDAATMTAAYNAVCSVVLAADPQARVGGPGLGSAWEEQLTVFLKGAKKLSFVSFHFFGSHNPVTETDTLSRAAFETKASDLPSQLSFQQVARLVRKLRKDNPEIYVTEFALNEARDNRGAARDERARTAVGAAWMASSLLSGGPWVDKIIHWKLSGEGWGMVAENGSPDTLYWVAWLLRGVAPRGASRMELFRPNPQSVVATYRTKTAINVVISYTGIENVRFDIDPQNIVTASQVRLRGISDADDRWHGEDLAPTLEQSVTLEGPGVVILQYVL